MKLLLLVLFLFSGASWAAYSPGTFIVDQTGTNAAAVKAASTAAVGADPAVVVAISPNNSIAVGSSALPTGAATSALQTTGNTALTTINTTLGSPFQAGGSIGNASFGISGTLPAFAATPTFNLGTLNGAATAVKQPALGTAGTASTDVITVQGIASMTALKVDGSAVTQPVSLSGNQAVNTAQINGVTPLMGNGVTGTGSQRVTIASDNSTIAVNQAGRAKANAPVRNDYTSTAVTTGAYVQLVASTTSATSMICVFDSSGQTLTIATGAAASEVSQMNVFPGGNGCEPLNIAAGTRVSIKSLSATASVGELDVNFYQ